MLGRIPRLKAWIPTVGIAFALGNASRNLSVSIGGFIEILAEDSVAQGFFEGFLRRQSWRKDSWGRERGGGSSKDPSWIVRPDRRGAINRDSVRILRGHFQEPTAGSFQEILFRCCNGQISSNKSGSCRDAFEVCARLSHSALRQEPRSRWQ